MGSLCNVVNRGDLSPLFLDMGEIMGLFVLLAVLGAAWLIFTA